MGRKKFRECDACGKSPAYIEASGFVFCGKCGRMLELAIQSAKSKHKKTLREMVN